MVFKKYLFKYLSDKNKGKELSDKENLLANKIADTFGYRIKNIEIFVEAFSLKSPYNNTFINNERLEFLGDSVLDSIISVHIFKLYPDENEGFLTQLKSKIVNRKHLNKLGDELQLVSMIQTQKDILSQNISGNLFEALIGAIYLDSNFKICEKIVLKKMLTDERIFKLENKIISYKSLLLEWSQKKKVSIHYQTQEEEHCSNKVFKTFVIFNDEKIANASEVSKKKAEEKAAQRAFYYLNKKEQILETTKINP